ncbi:MAG: outer membrane lipoprotein chaperone LolA [Geobacter sp.]|nr:outer membrane lipoprotein chaperone LolA [Geobacter sp.]
MTVSCKLSTSLAGPVLRIVRRLPCFALALLGAIWLTGATAAAAELDDVVATLEQGYAILEDVQASFVQRAAIASLKREEKGGGEMLIKRPQNAPAMFRFDYTKPQKQQIISNGKTLWFYVPDNQQVMVTNLNGLMENSGVSMNYLTGLGHVSRDFSIAFAGDGKDSKGNYVLQLTPKKKSQLLARLQLTIKAEAVEGYLREGKAVDPFPVLTSVVHDQAGNRTTLEFHKIRVNKGLSGSLFQFRVPSGVEVIKQ